MASTRDLHEADGPRFDFGPARGPATPDRFVFLFVGAAVARKGVDVLLDAYGRAFDGERSGDVGDQGPRRRRLLPGSAAGRGDRGIPRPPGAPDLQYLDAYLERRAPRPPSTAPATPASFPYRAEGFAMPILEAMACGTPVDRSALRRLPRLLRRRHRVPGAGAAHPAAGRAQPAVQHARVSRRRAGGRLLRGRRRRPRRRDAAGRFARSTRARGGSRRGRSGPGPSRGRLRSSGFASVSRA